MEFLVEFEVKVPEGTPESEVGARQRAEAVAAARLADEGHLVRVWRRPVGPDESTVLGLYRADSERELRDLLGALPLSEWMHVTVTPLQSHPNDPAASQANHGRAETGQL
jgi:muconolactone delta-isomerase